jgi:hypothetical protein
MSGLKLPHLWLLTLACAAYAGTAQEGGIVFSGVSQNDIVALELVDKSKPVCDQFDFAGANLLTLTMRNANAKVVRVDASVDFWLLLGAYADAYRRADSSQAPAMLQSPSAAFIADVRKLYCALYLPYADISIGRQIVSFGQGMVFSPIDVFSSVNILDLSLRRRGSDVARVRVPFGDLAGIDALAKVGSRSEGIAAAIKGFGHLGTFDIASIGIYQTDLNEFVTGLTFKGDLAAGVYGELVEHWRYSGYRAFVGMLGADYSINGDWYVTVEYLYNEKPQPAGTPSQFSLVQTNIALMHNHYGFLSARYKINDLMNVSASAIADISAKSGFITAQYSYNVLQNADVVVYVQGYPASINGLLPIPYAEVTYGVRVKVAF